MSQKPNDIDDDTRQRIEYLRRKLTRLEQAVNGATLTPLHRATLCVQLAKVAAKMDKLEQGVEDAAPREVLPEPAVTPKEPKAMRYQRD